MKTEIKIRTLSAILEDCASQLSQVYAKYDKQDATTLECLNNVITGIDLLMYEVADDFKAYCQSAEAIRTYNKMIADLK